jgi:hypothetical protein
MWNRPSVLIEALEYLRDSLRMILSKSTNLITQALSFTRRVVFFREGPRQQIPILHRLRWLRVEPFKAFPSSENGKSLSPI